QGSADFGGLHIRDIAERILRVVGDSDRDHAVGFGACPFVGLGVAEIGGDVAHELFFNSTNGGLTSCKFNLAPRISTASGWFAAAVVTSAEPIASLRIGESVPDNTRPTV